MTKSITARRAPAGARLGLIVLLALVLSTFAMFNPSGAAAESPRGDRSFQSGGPGGQSGPPTAGNPGNGTTNAAGFTTDEASTESSATVTTGLNLRSGPSIETEILTVMPAGSIVQITGGLESGFYAVTFNGTSGYAYADYLSIGGSAPNATTDASGGATTGVSAGSDIVAIIYAAADAYGQPREDMLRVAICESGLDPYNVTPPYSASGLFQFLPSTWASTPFAAQDIFDPVANANAAAWMWSVGRRGEWVCQ